MSSTDDALKRLSMRRTSQVADRRSWFTNGDEYPAAHAHYLDRLLADAPPAPADLRDTLYARERLPALQHHLNYHRAHDVETFNPLLDVDVVRFYRTLKAAYRLDKQLFKKSFQRQFGHHLDIPIATRDNSIDWPRAVRESPRLAGFLRRGVEALPAPFERAYFLAQLEAVIRGADRNAGDLPAAGEGDGAHRVPPVRLVIRALILGQWLRTWGY